MDYCLRFSPSPPGRTFIVDTIPVLGSTDDDDDAVLFRANGFVRPIDRVRRGPGRVRRRRNRICFID